MFFPLTLLNMKVDPRKITADNVIQILLTFMPLLKLETTVGLSEEQQKNLSASLSRLVAEGIGKPERYVMVSIQPARMLMSGQGGDAAFIDIRSIGGLSGGVNKQLSQKICALLKQTLQIAPDRVYLNFTDVPAGDWGWNGDTFG
jgi:phenylpyruvate tautomerase